MNFVERLRASAKKRGSIVCMGLDPVPSALPEGMQSINHVPGFFEKIFQEMKDQGVFPGAFKPNQGFYVSHDQPRGTEEDPEDIRFDGSTALCDVMGIAEAYFPDIPIILDSKRGDIATSSANYAREGFESWQAGAVTVAPFMGTDSVGPFAEFCKGKEVHVIGSDSDGPHIESFDQEGKGVYVLCRTSNPGAGDFQNLQTADGTPFYIHVARKIVEWAKDSPGVGAVVGATAPDELSRIVEELAGKDIPLLIPGVGGQGGSAEDVMKRLRDGGYDTGIVRINSSSGLTHPWAKKKQAAPDDYAKVCVAKLKELNEQIGYKPAA